MIWNWQRTARTWSGLRSRLGARNFTHPAYAVRPVIERDSQATPKPPKPTGLKASRMSKITQKSSCPNPLRLSYLFSIGYLTKWADFSQKDGSVSLSPPKSNRSGLSKASKPNELKDCGMCDLGRKRHCPNPLRLSPDFSAVYRNKWADFRSKDGHPRSLPPGMSRLSMFAR